MKKRYLVVDGNNLVISNFSKLSKFSTGYTPEKLINFTVMKAIQGLSMSVEEVGGMYGENDRPLIPIVLFDVGGISPHRLAATKGGYKGDRKAVGIVKKDVPAPIKPMPIQPGPTPILPTPEFAPVVIKVDENPFKETTPEVVEENPFGNEVVAEVVVPSVVEVNVPREAMKIFKEWCSLMGFLQLSHYGIEADDIAYALAKKFDQEEQSATFISNDRDWLTILARFPRFSVWNPIQKSWKHGYEMAPECPVSDAEPEMVEACINVKNAILGGHNGCKGFFKVGPVAADKIMLHIMDEEGKLVQDIEQVSTVDWTGKVVDGCKYKANWDIAKNFFSKHEDALARIINNYNADSLSVAEELIDIPDLHEVDGLTDNLPSKSDMDLWAASIMSATQLNKAHKRFIEFCSSES